MGVSFCLFVRVNRTGFPCPSADEFCEKLSTIFGKKNLGSFAPASVQAEQKRTRIFLRTSLEDHDVPRLKEFFLELRVAVVEAQVELGLTDEVDSISAVAMREKHSWKGENLAGLGFPAWIPGEYANSIILDESAASLMPSSAASEFEVLRFEDAPVLYIAVAGDHVIEKAKEASIRAMHLLFRNIPADSGEVPAMTLKLDCDGIEDVLRVAEQVYSDVEVDKGVGGRSLLIGFCLERNSRLYGKGKAVFPNASALGLRYSCEPDSLVDHVRSGRLLLESTVGEPVSKKRG